MDKIIYKTKVDTDELGKWRDPERDDIPPTSFIAIYKALGIVDAITEYKKDHPDLEVVPVLNVQCNTLTHSVLKKFLENIWAIYSLDIDADNHVFWDTSKWAKGKKHYAKKLKTRIAASLYDDFKNYCPGINDELGVGEIAFVVPQPEEKKVDAPVEAQHV